MQTEDAITKISRHAAARYNLDVIQDSVGYFTVPSTDLEEALKEACKDFKPQVKYLSWNEIERGTDNVFKLTDILLAANMDRWLNNNAKRFDKNTIYVFPIDTLTREENKKTYFYSVFTEYFEGGSGRMNAESKQHYKENHIHFLFILSTKEDFLLCRKNQGRIMTLNIMNRD